MLQLSKEDGQAAPVAIRREDYTAPAYCSVMRLSTRVLAGSRSNVSSTLSIQ